MNEHKIDTEQQPKWLELPDKREYWITRIIPPNRDGLLRKIFHKAHDYSGEWSAAFYSKEDAEAEAVRSTKTYKWNGKPTEQITLASLMQESRKMGRRGVHVQSFQCGKWVTVKEYRCDEPLPEDLR